MHNPAENKNGFSLVELSIVLVILGLLVGGIMTGQNLIRAAELRSIPTQFQTFQTAINLFKGKYLALPGDMGNATSFWDPNGVCPGNNTSPATGTETCNGNGDGNIGRSQGAASVEDAEVFTAWQHLANAGLIEGTYSGVTDHTSPDTVRYTLGFNVPRAKVDSSGWTLFHRIGDLDSVVDYNHHVMIIGGFVTADNWPNLTFSAEDTWNIDKKLDDGKPTMGRVRSSGNTSSPNCSTADDETSEYLLSGTVSKACRIIFLLD